MNRHKHPKHPSRAGNESIVYEYFRLIKSKDINGVLNLFTDDAIIYEPFSNIDGGLKGKGSIRPFLDVVMAATDDMRHEIEFEKTQDANKEDDQAVAALVTFERGGKTQARYIFELTSRQEQYDYTDVGKKIQILHIELIK
ncbi:MAG TPA: nuclear transport factor 2 family protein [Candidatus Bathyarchaeia archaeon]|nr:nuclear transport factor 2 family protein [Candidatus Bathyarchaeia archaeon]